MDPRVASLIGPFVEAARSYVRRALKLELDSSPESLAYVDHYVRSVHDENNAPGQALEPDVLRLTAAAIGAYFGEVVIAAFGGGWAIDAGTEAAPERWRVELDPPTVSFSPVAMAAYAIAGAKASDLGPYDDHVSPPFRDTAALQQLLEGRGPVDADYYYSLTGRYELFEQMRELLAEIDRRRQVGPPPDEPSDDDDDDKILN